MPMNGSSAFIQSVFEKKVVSSVFLTGEGFENNWYPLSLKVLCNGRRAFIGNNLYSKGACYHAWHQTREEDEIPVYLDDSKMMEQVCLRMRVHGKEAGIRSCSGEATGMNPTDSGRCFWKILRILRFILNRWQPEN